MADQRSDRWGQRRGRVTHHTRPAGEHDGMVTAEAAAVLPLMSVVAVALTWLVSVGITQVRVVDAARDAARAVARGDGAGSAQEAARRTAGAAASVAIHRDGDLVSVTVSEQASAPGWLLVPLPSVTLRAEASVMDERG